MRAYACPRTDNPAISFLQSYWIDGLCAATDRTIGNPYPALGGGAAQKMLADVAISLGCILKCKAAPAGRSAIPAPACLDKVVSEQIDATRYSVAAVYVPGAIDGEQLEGAIIQVIWRG